MVEIGYLGFRVFFKTYEIFYRINMELSVGNEKRGEICIDKILLEIQMVQELI